MKNYKSNSFIFNIDYIDIEDKSELIETLKHYVNYCLVICASQYATVLKSEGLVAGYCTYIQGIQVLKESDLQNYINNYVTLIIPGQNEINLIKIKSYVELAMSEFKYMKEIHFEYSVMNPETVIVSSIAF